VFTGIVEGLGSLSEMTRTERGVVIAVTTEIDISDCAIGASIAVDGCCLTVVTRHGGRFTCDVSHESLACTTLGSRSVGDRVNLERPVAVGDRLGGHIVQGHVDATGSIAGIRPAGEATDYDFRCPAELTDEIVEKGSITVDGISLTVNAVDPAGGFSVTIIPHTAAVTTLGSKVVGDPVNLETDIVGKYIVALARRGRAAQE